MKKLLLWPLLLLLCQPAYAASIYPVITGQPPPSQSASAGHGGATNGSPANPPAIPGTPYPFASMNVGDSFFIGANPLLAPVQAANFNAIIIPQYIKNTGSQSQFMAYPLNGVQYNGKTVTGIGIWRTQ